MDWLLIGIGIALLALLGWYLHRRFGDEKPQVHSNVKPSAAHDPKSLVGQGLEGQSIE